MSQESETLQRYISAILQALLLLTADEENREDILFTLPSFDAENLDPTLFITAMPYAIGVWIRGNTTMRPDHLEVTHLLNSLVSQYERKEAVREAKEEAA